MLALSVRQPWAHAIVHLGKRCENRTWATRYRGPVLLQAAKGMTRDEYAGAVLWTNSQWRKPPMLGTPPPAFADFGSLPRGGIVARATIIDCIRSPGALPFGKSRAWGDAHIVPWWMGPVGIILDDVEPLPFVPYAGALGLFEVPDEMWRAAA